MRADSHERKGASHDARRLRVAEIYASQQGEGRWTGAPSVFLRTSGCNLRCWFCDTPFASWRPEGALLTVDEVVKGVLAYAESDVVITGGEPLLSPSMTEITKELRRAGRRITIETAATVDLDFECDLLSMSPKLASSAPDRIQHPAWHMRHQQRRQQLDLVRKWIAMYDYQLKFVVADAGDLEEIESYLSLLPSSASENVWLMPEGTSIDVLDSRAEWLAPYCLSRGYRFCSRSHIYWYGNRRGT